MANPTQWRNQAAARKAMRTGPINWYFVTGVACAVVSGAFVVAGLVGIVFMVFGEGVPCDGFVVQGVCVVPPISGYGE